MTLQNDFVESSYSLTLFEAYLGHLLGALLACNAFSEFLCGIFASKNVNLHAVQGVHCPKYSKTCPFLFILYTFPGDYADI